MPTYIVLYKMTDQGMRSVKATVQRARESQLESERQGFRILDVYWTQGRYDAVAIMEAADDATMMAGLLNIASAGNVRSETLRAFTASEMEGVIGKM
jgi:uncharacterized protein with GYD domain